jgi:methylated-DNA-[protein]-cysteine S-methyltransferase
MERRYWLEIPSPIGPLTLVSDGTHLVELHMRPAAEALAPQSSAPQSLASQARARQARAQQASAQQGRARQSGAQSLEWQESAPTLRAARAQVDAYFAGELRAFDLPLRAEGTPFQRAVWAALEGIPFGTTASYGAIAALVGAPGSARAVGAANGRNPIAIVVPCHRVIGADGRLVGYGGGLDRKTWLLGHEARVATGAEQFTLV